MLNFLFFELSLDDLEALVDHLVDGSDTALKRERLAIIRSSRRTTNHHLLQVGRLAGNSGCAPSRATNTETQGLAGANRGTQLRLKLHLLLLHLHLLLHLLLSLLLFDLLLDHSLFLLLDG